MRIRGATVYDGTGAPGVVRDVVVRGDRIVDDDGAPDGEELDGRGLALAPGFVDVHTHDDGALLVDPELRCKTLQGVTTDVVGNCGMGIAPHDIGLHLFGAWTPGLADVPPWDGYGGYLARLDAEPPSLNVGVLIGHGTVRGAVLGRHDVAPSAADLDAMRELVAEGMDAGALGLSTGLIYEPGRYATTDEVIALAAVARDGIYTTHMRNEGEHLLDAVAEAIRIGEEAGIRVQISHHKASGRASWGKVVESLAMIDAARARGVDVSLDQYPYTAGSTSLYAVVQNGSLDEGSGGLGELAPSDVLVASANDHPEWEGLHLGQVADLLELSPRAAADAVIAGTNGSAIVVLESMCEDDVQRVLAHERTMIGSDGIPAPGKPHPRLWGTFPRVLGRYARDLGVLPLAEAIRRMTSLPCETFGLTDRGVIRAGALADLVLFDPATIADVGTYADPARPPLGIHAVLVNGIVVARDGEHTGARPGRALRR
jgi:N-acyl-D-amino-acid deacylase